MSFHSMSDKVIYKSLAFLGYPNYRVGTDGSVWSKCVKGNNKGGTGKWRKLRATLIKSGKLQGRFVINLYRGRKTFLVHRLVLLAFIGPCPEGMECCHSDGNPANNRLENLRWDTRKNNQADRIKHGTDCKGKKHWNVKLTEDNVREIRSRMKKGENRYTIADSFGISEATVRDIHTRKSWTHLD